MEPQYIIGIIAGAGVFGGIVNYFRNVFDKKIQLKLMLKPILLGLAASALMPLFLNMISSDLLDGSETSAYFVFLGFCLVAAIFSGEFIDSIGNKVLEQLEEVQEELEESNTEDEQPEINEFRSLASLSENQEQLLRAFTNSKYTFRSISGLAKQLNLDRNSVKEELLNLEKMGLVEVVERKKGVRWKITIDGHQKI